MHYKEHLKRTISLSTPLIIGQLGHMAMGVVDNLMIGQVSSLHLAAAALANSIFTPFLVLGLGLTFALSALVAASNQKGNEAACSALLHHSLFINVVAAFLLAILVWISPFIIPYLDQDPQVIKLAIPYLKIVAISFFPLMIFQTYRQFGDGLTYAKVAMVIIIVTNLVNVFFNWVFIYGKLGFPAMELNGAGYSTLVNRVFAMLAIVLYINYSRHFKAFNPGKFIHKFQKELILKLLHLGIPSSLQTFLETFAFTSVAFIVGWIGVNALAAHQIALTLASVTFMFALGISQAAAIRVGTAFGKKNDHEARMAGMAGISLSAVVMGINGLIFILFKQQLVGYFVKEQVVQDMAATLLVIAALFQIFDGIQAVGVGALRGLQDAKIPTVIVFISYWILSIPVGYILSIPLGLGVDGVWYGFVTGLGSASILLTYRFWQHTASKTKKARA